VLVDSVDVLVICGAAGVGKSSTAYEVAHLLAAANLPHAMLDCDELDRVHPWPPPGLAPNELSRRNLTAVWSNLAALPGWEEVRPTLEGGGLDGSCADRPGSHDADREVAMVWGDGWGWGAWLVMSIMMVLFWGLVIAGIVVLVRYLTGSRQGGGPAAASGRSSAEDILAERFARGEIDEDEYTKRRQRLREDR
jgi:uncharacterized membrane protein